MCIAAGYDSAQEASDVTSDTVESAMGDLIFEAECDYRYLADETDEWYQVTPDDVADLGAAKLSGATDYYSLWCSGCGVAS